MYKDAYFLLIETSHHTAVGKTLRDEREENSLSGDVPVILVVILGGD